MWKPNNPTPITDIGDPYILKHDGRYYLYATSGFDGFYVRSSEDLHQWSQPSVCYRRTERSFGSKCFWAPEVYCFDGKFYMYYTAQWKCFEDEALRIGVAVSDDPMGPFTEVHDAAPMFDFGYGVLDAHIFSDDDGKRYLYYSRAAHENYVNGFKEADIYVVRLAEDLISVAGEAVCLIQTDQEWERCDGKIQFWNEGPFVLKHEGRYHLMYSANFFGSKYYGVGGAVADSPMGPFVKYDCNPILSYVEGLVSGPGHNSVVEAPDGGLLCVYHAHTHYDRPSGNRQVYIDRIHFEDGKIKIDGPTVGSKA